MKVILEEFLLDDIENYQEILKGRFSMTYPSALCYCGYWHQTVLIACECLCTHAYTFVSGIGNPPQKYKIVRNIGPNCHSRVKETGENETEALKRREGCKLWLLDWPNKSTGSTVKSELQINNRYLKSVSMSQILHGTYLY